MSDAAARQELIEQRRKRRAAMWRAIPRIHRFQIVQLLHLLRYRDQKQIPDDARSRRYLQALLDLGLTGPEAQRIAPWISNDDLKGMIERTVVGPHWNARDLGDLFEVTLEEKLACGLRNLEAFDADRWQYQEQLAKRRRLRDAQRKQMKRRETKKMNNTTTTKTDTLISRTMPTGTPPHARDMVEACYQRQRLLYDWMTGKGWVAIADLARGTLRQEVPAYDQGLDQRRRDLRSLEQTLHRDVDDLVDIGLLIERKMAGPKGGLPRREIRQAVDNDGV